MIFTPSLSTKASRKVIREAIARFEKVGESGMHSEAGVILSHILNHCTANRIEFTLQYAPGGFMVRKGLTPQITQLEHKLLKYAANRTEEWRGSITGDPDPSTLQEFDKTIRALKAVVKKLAPHKVGRR